MLGSGFAVVHIDARTFIESDNVWWQWNCIVTADGNISRDIVQRWLGIIAKVDRNSCLATTTSGCITGLVHEGNHLTIEISRRVCKPTRMINGYVSNGRIGIDAVYRVLQIFVIVSDTFAKWHARTGSIGIIKQAGGTCGGTIRICTIYQSVAIIVNAIGAIFCTRAYNHRYLINACATARSRCSNGIGSGNGRAYCLGLSGTQAITPCICVWSCTT